MKIFHGMEMEMEKAIMIVRVILEKVFIIQV